MKNRFPTAQERWPRQGEEIEMTKRIKPKDGNKTFCMAPWTHTFLSPQMERRLCCSSREDSQNFKQYIDTLPKNNLPTSKINLQTLEQHWNSDYMKAVRLKLMAGEEIPQCQVCNHKLLSVATYRSHFNKLYEKQIDEAFEKTNQDGSTNMQVTSWDYRFNNLCNFKCRMCGDMLSSSWEAENRKHEPEIYEKDKIWGRSDIKAEIEKFHDKHIVKEFSNAIESKKIKEIYWCGGEPLMWKIHWESMLRIIDLGYQDEVSIRYNSNMSRVNYFGKNLFDDILDKFKYWNILASIDGVGEVGEYVRTGLKWEEWYGNIEHGLKFVNAPQRQIRIDLTMTLPGMLGLEGMLDAGESLGVPILAKRVFGFSSDNVWSPMCLPRHILDRLVDEFIQKNKKRLTRHTYFYAALKDLKEKPTYEQMFPDKWQEGLKRGKKRVEYLDKIRKTDIKKILKRDKEVLNWWNAI
tara:strand:+ start:132 stop:1523 length:1392 start_codon:yes stop_codon:yes gene_type:complete